MFCNNCGNEIDGDAIFCTTCGCKLNEISHVKFCPSCGNKLEDDALFCSNCGFKISSSEIKVEHHEESYSPTDELMNDHKPEEKSVLVENPNKITHNTSIRKKDIIILVSVCALVLIGYVIFNSNNSHNSKKISPWLSNNTYNFDVFKPYTCNSTSNKDEFDCYNLSDKQIKELWNNPPKYAVYNSKSYELDNINLDFFEIQPGEDIWTEEFGSIGFTLKQYNVIIHWDDFDGTYHHFAEIFVLDGNKGFALYKYIDFSKYEF